MLKVLCLLICALVLINSETEAPEPPAGVSDFIDDLLTTTKLSLQFLESNAETAHFDVGIGTSMLQGQLQAILNDAGPILWNADPILFETVQQLVNQAGRVTAIIARNAAVVTPLYFNKLWPLLLPDKWARLATRKPELVLPQQFQLDDKIFSFNESAGDDCFAELMGTSKALCTVSSECLDIMLRPAAQDYSLTHQLFYFLIAFEFKCVDEADAVCISTGNCFTVADIFQGLCRKILTHSFSVFQDGVNSEDRDLFMEEIGFCALAGFEDSLPWEYIQAVSNWQSKSSGCYGIYKGEMFNMENSATTGYGHERRRRKRVEALLSDSGCLGHRTTVALMAMHAYLKKHIENVMQLALIR